MVVRGVARGEGQPTPSHKLTVKRDAGAQAVGLDLAPEVVVVFGDPAVGTRLMQQDPAIGVELPLKLLVWEQDSGVRVGFVDPATWPARYAVSADHPVLAGMRRLLNAVAEQAAGPA